MRKNEEHPQDYAQSRFTAFWMIVCALAVFVVVLCFVLKVNSGRMDAAANVVEDERAEERFKTLAAVNAEQRALVEGAAVVDEAKNTVRIPVADGMKLVLPALKNKKPAATKIVVPGSPTSLKQAPAESESEEGKEGKEGDAKKAETSAKKEDAKPVGKEGDAKKAKPDTKEGGAMKAKPDTKEGGAKKGESEAKKEGAKAEAKEGEADAKKKSAKPDAKKEKPDAKKGDAKPDAKKEDVKDTKPDARKGDAKKAESDTKDEAAKPDAKPDSAEKK